MLQINESFYKLQGKDLFVHKNHSHNEIEFIQVIRGSGNILKSSKTYVMQSHHLYIIDAREAHIVYPKPEDCAEYVRNKIVIGADSLVDFCKRLGLYELLLILLDSPPIPTAQSSRFDELFLEISKLLSTKSTADVGLAHGYIIELMHLAYSNLELCNKSEQKSTLDGVLMLIAESEGSITLSEIAERVHMNKHYICHLFKEKAGITLTDFISEKLFEKSCRLLTGTDLSVENIALSCGFSSSASFCRFFKKKQSLSPLAYRNRSRSKSVLTRK